MNFFLICKAKLGLFLFIFILFPDRMDKYSTNLTINDKIVNVMLGSETRGGRMEGAEEFTELCRHPFILYSKYVISF